MVKFGSKEDDNFSNVRKQLQRLEKKFVAPDPGV
jgi:hypothetical protein